MLKSLAVLGALLALQAAGVQWYYTQKYAGAGGLTCPEAAAIAAAANTTCPLAAAAECNPADGPRVEILHEDARIFVYHNFLSEEECDHIIKLAEPHMNRSRGAGKGGFRNSKGALLARAQDPVITAIEKRIAKWTLMPATNGEALQVLKHEKGVEYEDHSDYMSRKQGTSNGGLRYLTMVMYLNDVEEGGETCFPNIPAAAGAEYSSCCPKLLAVKPRKGSALLFHTIRPTGELERRSVHTSCPVLKGSKWSAPKHVHVGRYAVGGERPVAVEQRPMVVAQKPAAEAQPAAAVEAEEVLVAAERKLMAEAEKAAEAAAAVADQTREGAAAGVPEVVVAVAATVPKVEEAAVAAADPYAACQDRNEKCGAWAAGGECSKNPPFMVGSKERPGQCVRACGMCADIY